MPSEASNRLGVGRAFREAATSALLAFGLLLTLIGFNTVQNIHNELILETRWPLLAILVAIIAAGRFAYSLVIAPWLDRRISSPRRDRKLTGWVSHLTSGMTPVVVAFANLYPALALWLAGSQGR
jgi:branched-chain amino acid transport system permease protein